MKEILQIIDLNAKKLAHGGIGRRGSFKSYFFRK